MIDITNKENCTGCHACQGACPVKCIKMSVDEEGFLYPEVDKDKCIDCGLCERVCPVISPQKTNKSENDIVAYGAYNKNEDVRMKSSSGGVFTLIAEEVIARGGVVFGACFDNKLNVVHSFAENKEDLEKFRGSKYLQSIIGSTYKQAKGFLDQGRLVYFSGTPCQIGGLYSYLGKSYDNLVTQDIICHGVPSPLIWQKYLDEVEKKLGGEIREASFRSKASSWRNFRVVIKTENKMTDESPHQRNVYMLAFLKNFILRPSCYECHFKDKVRKSDITLADFWGVEKVNPSLDDDKGTSLVLINSAKGMTILEKISDKIAYERVDIDEALRYNPPAIMSVDKNPQREKFFALTLKSGFSKSSKLLSKRSLKSRVRSLVKRMLIRLGVLKQKGGG